VRTCAHAPVGGESLCTAGAPTSAGPLRSEVAARLAFARCSHMRVPLAWHARMHVCMPMQPWSSTIHPDHIILTHQHRMEHKHNQEVPHTAPRTQKERRGGLSNEALSREPFAEPRFFKEAVKGSNRRRFKLRGLNMSHRRRKEKVHYETLLRLSGKCPGSDAQMRILQSSPPPCKTERLAECC
jgi:hypothetical protein